MKKILVISPHPDDEVIGCGGTLAKYISDGSKVEIIFLTSGERGIKGLSKNETKNIRETEARKTAELMKFQNIVFWEESDGNFKVNQKLVQKLLQHIKVFNPDLVLVTHDSEQHPDHKQATLLVRDAVKEISNQTRKPDVWMYEVWTPIQKIDIIEDITEFMNLKIKAIQTYASQCRILKFDDAILGLNRYRGEMHSWPGGDYAEIFKKIEL